MTTLANVPYVHDPNTNWLYIVGRVKPHVSLTVLQEKLSTQIRQIFAGRRDFTSEHGKELLARARM